jgi:Ca-activated chloride channel family protein
MSSADMGVGQGGSQDFGAFRQILDEGGIPGPSTIDDVGFFAEHVVELPTAECDDDICVHGVLGMMGNMIDGSDCTVVLLGLNTTLDAENLERPPLNLALAVDTSGSMAGESMEWVRTGLLSLVDALEPGDRLTLVDFDTDAEIVIKHAVAGDDDAAMDRAIQTLEAAGGTNIYDGLLVAFESVDEIAEEGMQNRVILLSDGLATSGNTNANDILDLAEYYAEIGYGLTTIGMGSNFDIDLMRDLAEAGAGAFYFLEDPSAVEEVFVEEVETFLVPIGQDATIELDVSDDYTLRNIFGTTDHVIEGNHVTIDIPLLQLAKRTSDEDNEAGRRGGGMTVIAEMVPNEGAQAGEVGAVGFSFTEVSSGEVKDQSLSVVSPINPDAVGIEGEFLDPSVEKAFVMLNVYVGFEMAAAFALENNDTAALQTLTSLCRSVTHWLKTHDDADIEDDLVYVERFIANLEARQPQDWNNNWSDDGGGWSIWWIFD